MDTVLLIAYILVLLALTALLVLCLKRGGRKRWCILLGGALSALLLALGLARYFDTLPGTGMMPGLTYFAHTLYSMTAAVVYGCLLLVSLLLGLWQYLKKK